MIVEKDGKIINLDNVLSIEKGTDREYRHAPAIIFKGIKIVFFIFKEEKERDLFFQSIIDIMKQRR